jgi:methionyl-tRNA formyltransferase
VSYASKINVEDARIDWTQPAEIIDRLIRACSPVPGAWTTFCGERLKINSASLTGAELPPGTLEVTKRFVRVGTATVSVELGQVQPPGKKPMPAADWARGNSFADRPRLGS